MVKKYINHLIKTASSIFGLDLPYFIKGGFWLVLANLIALVGGIFLSSVFSRVWPKDVYGQFSFLTSAVGLLGITTLTGLNEAVFQGSIENRDGIYNEALRKVFFGFNFWGFYISCRSILFFLKK